MSRMTLVLALAGALAAASALGAQPPAGAPPAGPGAPGRAPAARRPMARRLQPGPNQPGPGGPGRMMGFRVPGGGPSVAERLLGRTGELKLTDQQVLRLAAIARRADDRRRAFRARVDSLRLAFRADTAARRRAFAQGGPQGGPLAADLQRMRDQARADLRDALTVLTPDQQAQAWEMAAMRGGGAGAPAGPAALRRGPRAAARLRAPRANRMRPPGLEDER